MKIRIVSVPDGGEAPLEILEAWIGVTMSTIGEEKEFLNTRGSLSHRLKPPMVGIEVSSRQAMWALRRSTTNSERQTAFRWWERNTSHPCDHITLIFPKGCYVVVAE